MRMGSPDFNEEEEIPFKEETSFTSSSSSPTKGGLTHHSHSHGNHHNHSNRNSHAFSFETTSVVVLSPDLPKSSVFRLLRVTRIRSLYVVLIKAKINLLLPFGPLAIAFHYLTGKHGWVFFFSIFGITHLAERLGFVIEYVSFRAPITHHGYDK